MTTATQFNVSNKLTLVGVTKEGDDTFTEYKCNRTVVLAGDSIWDCALKTVCITGIHITETQWNDDEDCDIDSTIHISVTHTGGKDSWRLYTDTGFAYVVSKLLGCDVSYTEQGMQDDGVASMEL
jgi:hypothetical protein